MYSDSDGSTGESEQDKQSAFFLDVVITENVFISKLLASEDQTLLVNGYSFFVLDLSFQTFNGVGRLHFHDDSLFIKVLNENFHV